MRNESDIRWIVQTLREAAWAPLLVLCPVVIAEGIFDLFTRFPWVDIPTHFLGGIAVTYFFWCASANAQSIAGHIPKVSHAVLAFGCTASTALLWELVEFLLDRFLGAHMQHGLGDTSSDIFFGLAGGVAYLILRRWFATSSTAHVLAEPPDV
ncbi:MAG TPA: hypothetical protein VIJ43_05310 [Burkholderiales bacterium]